MVLTTFPINCPSYDSCCLKDQCDGKLIPKKEKVDNEEHIVFCCPKGCKVN